MVIKSEENSFSIVVTELLKEMGDLITRSPIKNVKPNILNITLQKFLVMYMVVTQLNDLIDHNVSQYYCK